MTPQQIRLRAASLAVKALPQFGYQENPDKIFGLLVLFETWLNEGGDATYEFIQRGKEKAEVLNLVESKSR